MSTDNKNEEQESGFRVEDKRSSATEEERSASPSSDQGASEESATKTPTPSRFSRFVASLHMTALYHLGLVPGPSGERPQPNLQLARENIDIMDELTKKTEGNLTAEEDELLKHLLSDARQRYLQAAMHS